MSYFYNPTTPPGTPACTLVTCGPSQTRELNSDGLWVCKTQGITCKPGETPILDQGGVSVGCTCPLLQPLDYPSQGDVSCVCPAQSTLGTNDANQIICQCSSPFIDVNGACGCPPPRVYNNNNGVETCQCPSSYSIEPVSGSPPLLPLPPACWCKNQIDLPFNLASQATCQCDPRTESVFREGTSSNHLQCGCRSNLYLYPAFTLFFPFDKCGCPPLWTQIKDSEGVVIDCVCNGTIVDKGNPYLDCETDGGGVITL